MAASITANAIAASAASIAANATTSAASAARNTLAKNFDTFLTLLTQQLRNQDPLQPMRSEEFTQQLVQFTGVEQSIATNKNLEELLGLFRTGFSANIVNYLGKTVSARGDIGELARGAASWTYELPSRADRVTMTVSDAQGRTVFDGDGNAAAGRHNFAWDGRDNAGLLQPNGLYRLTVSAVDSAGTAMLAKTSIRGVVSGVETIDGETLLTVGGQKVPLDNVISVHVTDPANPA